jgi:hypothetical protein
MIIIENNFVLKPYLDLKEPDTNLDDLLQFISEYFCEKARKTIHQGISKKVLHVSGLALYHHQEFQNYFQKNNTHSAYNKIELVQGEFNQLANIHHWLIINDYLIDLTIKQFVKPNHYLPKFLKPLADSDCYISNNPQSLIYQLYKESN